jgi:uncharacterized protein (DUF1015 family)
MTRIEPFRAIRYATERSPDLSQRVAPPYDVLDSDDKARLLALDAKNFVALDLPHVPAKAAGPPAAYEAAAERLRVWLSDGTLTRDERPALYVYQQRYTHEGRQHVRRMFFARLRLEPLGGCVFPHEQTFGGPKEDRLALMRATRACLSPIFALFEDPAGAVLRPLENATSQPPLATADLDDVHNELWAVTDPAAVAATVSEMASRPVFIADGHHRYGTALLYRDELAVRQGPLPERHPANFALCVLCAMSDPGLVILPTHRVLPGIAVSPGRIRDDDQLEIAHLPLSGPDEAPRKLAAFGPQAVGLLSTADGEGREGFYMVRPRGADILRSVAPDRSDAWRGLALSFLHAYVLDRVVARQRGSTAPPEIHYVKAAAAAVEEARRTSGSAFLLQPTTMAELSAVCRAGDLMPQKSTFFYPKLASGLVVYPLEE